MRCPRHDLAVGPDQSCVLCRREASEPSSVESTAQGSSLGKAAALAALGIALGFAAALRWRETHGTPAAEAPVGPMRQAGGVVGSLKTANAIGRTGAYYLPRGYEAAPLPVMVAIHGTGGSGRSMVDLFRGIAEQRKFIIVAPDSRAAPNGQLSWEVPSKPGETSGDTAHIRACLDEVLAVPGVEMDRGHVLIVGHSGGASTAPYDASLDEVYTAYAVLHGGVFAGGLGGRRAAVRGWFSTGAADPMRPPLGVREAASRAEAAGMGPTTYHEFPGGHDVGPAEATELVAWWLWGSDTRPRPTSGGPSDFANPPNVR